MQNLKIWITGSVWNKPIDTWVYIQDTKDTREQIKRKLHAQYGLHIIIKIYTEKEVEMLFSEKPGFRPTEEDVRRLASECDLNSDAADVWMAVPNPCKCCKDFVAPGAFYWANDETSGVWCRHHGPVRPSDSYDSSRRPE